MHNQTQIFMLKCCPFCGGFIGKIPLYFIEFLAAGGDENFSRKKYLQWRRAMHNQTQIFMWKCCPFCGGFIGKIPLYFIEFLVPGGDEIFIGAVGPGGSGKVLWSIMISSQEQNQKHKEFKKKKLVFLSRAYSPPLIRWNLPF